MHKLSDKSFAVVCLGCKVNRAEIDQLSISLMSNRYSITTIENADVVIINTCTVTHVADKKTRQTVRKALSVNKDSETKFIVTGCAAVIHPEFFRNLDYRVVVVPKSEILDYLGINLKFDNKVLSKDFFRSRASIKVQDGCDNCCSYCIVCKARGSSTSLPNDSVAEIFKKYIDAGYKEIVLSGVNLGAYKYDNIDLTSLLSLLLNVIDEKFGSNEIGARIRISSIEPQNINESLIDLIANSNGRICRHLHLPLQSGSSKVLSEMNRKYDADYYIDLVDKIRIKIPSMAISTDIIVGFPGESDRDFNQTISISQYCKFNKIHVFPYSIRQGTKAAQRVDQIDEHIKSERAKILRELSDKLAKADMASRNHTTEYALCECEGLCRTESYHLVHISDGKKNELIEYTWN